MRKQDHLIQIIAAMDAAERRYFKLFSNMQTGEKRYLKLFDALENKKTYDSGALCKELGISSQQLAAEKHYLNQVLLSSLQSYDEGSFEVSMVYAQKEQARSLFARRLYVQALELTQRTMEKATKLEMFELMMELLQFEINCKNNIPGSVGGGETTVYRKLARVLEELVELREVRAKAVQLTFQRKDLAGFKKLMKHPVLQKKPDGLQSLKAKIVWIDIWIRYYIMEIDGDSVLDLSLLAEKLFDRHPEIGAIDSLSYVSNYQRLIVGYKSVRKYEQALAMVKKMAEVLNDPSFQMNKAKISSLQFYNVMTKAGLFTVLCRYDDALELYEQLYKQRLQQVEGDQYLILFNQAFHYLLTGKGSKALEKTEELFLLKTTSRQDMQPFSRLLLVMVHLDSDNYRSIPSLVKTTKIWLERHDYNFHEMDLFLKHALAIARMPMSKKQGWLKLQEEINEGKFKDYSVSMHLGKWVERKIKSISRG